MSKDILDLKPNGKQAKEVVKKLKKLKTEINALENRQKALEQKIRNASKMVIDSEVCASLERIPIDEVNRGKLSIDLEPLKKRGLTNYLKVYKCNNIHRLSDIKGLGVEAICDIRKEVHGAFEELNKYTLPTLSVDNKNDYSNTLVCLLYIYTKSEPIIKQIVDLNNRLGSKIYEYFNECDIILNGIKWLLASQISRTEAINAYLELKELFDNGFVNNITFALEELEKLHEVKPAKAWSHFSENSAKYYACLEKIVNVKINDVKSNGLKGTLAEEINNLELNLTGLKCILRSYQEFGVKYIIKQQNVLLGDEMGLGKTVQAIGAMVALRNEGDKYFVVVCPASVLINWCREIALHSDLKAYKIHGDNREKVLEEWLSLGGVAVTTYETLSRLAIEQFHNVSMLVVDEAHYIKNPKALRTNSLLQLKESCCRSLFMTGTPLENKVNEMLFLIKNLQPDVYKEVKDFGHMASVKMFKEKVSPVYFRRTRDDVLKELPDLIENEEWCDMTEEEIAKYSENTMMENFMAMRQVSWEIEDVHKSSKAIRLKELYNKALEEKRKIVVFSFFINTINQVQTLFGDKCVGCITGAVPPDKRQAVIDKFKNSPDGSILVAQIQAGGTGLNIQTASMIVICEPQLKPSTENQAISRAYRMGQTRNVIVYRLLCEDSVDEKIMEILENKQNVFDNFADKSIMGKHSIEITEHASKAIIAKEKERLSGIRIKQ